VGTGVSGGTSDLQACCGVPVRIGGYVVRNRLDDSRCVHIYGEECLVEDRVLRVDGVHVIYCADKGRDVNLVKIQAPDTVEISFNASEGVNPEFRRGLDVFPRDHGDVLVEGPEVY